MDASRFDAFTLSLAEIISRRGILGAIGAGVSTAAILAGLSLDAPLDAEARRKRKKKKRKKKCKNGKTKCNGKCRNLNSNNNNCGSCGNACDSDEECENGTCVNTTCTPDCTGAACGDDDGCGGLCDGTCPPGLDPTCNVNTGTCECAVNGNCCLDSDCPQPNLVCLNVQNQANCFCNPELVCGTVCCPVGTTCLNPGAGDCG